MKNTRITAALGIIILLTALLSDVSVQASELENLGNGIDEWTENAVNDAGDWINGAYNDSSDWVNGAYNDAGDWVSGAANDVGNFFGGLFGEKEEETTTINISELVTTVSEEETEEDPNLLMYYLGETVNTGHDTGYSKAETIKQSDPHFGWTLGDFSVSGFTRVITEDTDCPVFLKTVGDTVTLWFNLSQDIDCLDGDETLAIAEDTNGYDEAFGVKKTNFGRGTLIVKYTDYQNKSTTPTIYTDCLPAIETGANIKVEMFEEGDYEIALDYEIKKSPTKILNTEILSEFSNYSIRVKFKVRNGNCMVYPFDIVTGEELTNSAITENGFYLDLAMSRYLDINVKKEMLNDGADGLVEDTRFNRPAKDGDEYTGEGIYTITVSNRYTDQETEKIIYVGTNQILKAVAVNGMSFEEVKNAVSSGASIAEDGTLEYPE